jgi:hypothetical protein
MKVIIAILATLLTSQAAVAQSRSFTGPFTGYEAEALSEVWPEIRQAENFDDINWRAHGMSRPPGNPEAQQFLASNWDELRREERFADIDWESYDNRYARSSDRYGSDRYGRSSSSRTERYGRAERGFPEYERGGANGSPFTPEESAAMSRAWGQIREAARFEDIDWRAIGFSTAPGDREARRLMSRHWGQLREAGRFEDINWQSITGSRAR